MKLLINCFILLSFISCHNQKLGEFKFTNSWKNDSLGCIGFRRQNFKMILSKKTLVIGVSSKYIFNQLGTPNIISNNIDNKICIVSYFVEGGIQCIEKTNVTDAKSLSIKFINNKLVDIYLITP